MITDPSPAATATSHKPALAESANLREQNRRLARQVSAGDDARPGQADDRITG
jgi:hypothetical protein